ncbi:ADP-ribosylation factor-binding protein GGA3-like isoform X2 [Arapaima gigas]
MAAEEKQDTLDSWLNKATDPRNMSDRWDCIKGFYEEVNKVQDGVQIATRLLAHKIQSPQEKEALQALTVLEACMNNCGTQFHKEAGKFRFLNELIKVVSPKHLGLGSTEKVKSKVIECLYSWSQWLKDEDKIQEAYQMLKKKGIVKQDPKLPREFVMPPPSPRAAGSIFDDEDKSKLLGQLLKSRNPEDLQAANLLIKDVIKEEQDRMEKVRRRTSVLEEVEGTTERLRELQEKFKKTVLSPEEKQEMKSLYERCEKMRPTLFRLASDTTDNDAALGEILQANDKLILALNLYQETVERKVGDGTDLHHSGNKAPESRKETKTYHLIDFSALEFGQGEPISLSKPACSSSPLSLLEEELISLGLNEQPVEMTSLGSCSSQSHHEKLAWTRRDEDNDCGLRRAVWRDAGRSVLVARGSAVDGDAGPKEDPSLDPSQQSRSATIFSLWFLLYP